MQQHVFLQTVVSVSYSTHSAFLQEITLVGVFSR
jgi:hypothetical protein